MKRMQSLPNGENSEEGRVPCRATAQKLLSSLEWENWQHTETLKKQLKCMLLKYNCPCGIVLKVWITRNHEQWVPTAYRFYRGIWSTDGCLQECVKQRGTSHSWWLMKSAQAIVGEFIMHSSPQVGIQQNVRSSKLPTVGAFMLWKPAKASYQTFFFV